MTAPRIFSRLSHRRREDFQPVETLADDPCLMIYTSGTTGLAKGALHAHRVLLGICPASDAA